MDSALGKASTMGGDAGRWGCRPVGCLLGENFGRTLEGVGDESGDIGEAAVHSRAKRGKKEEEKKRKGIFLIVRAA